MLYVIATPIGNLKDISLRAIDTLKTCDFIIAENPNYSRRLLQYIQTITITNNNNFSLPNPPPSTMSSGPNGHEGEGTSVFPSLDGRGEGRVNQKEIVQFAEFNEQQVVKDLTRRLKKENGCLITDAGTPGISDPGFRLVRECVKENVQVIPIPGANAAITALSASGLPTDRFLFLGFLQKTVTKTVSSLQSAANAEATAIFYESPERILKTLSYISNAFPASQIVVARELTKIHEEFIRGTPMQVMDIFKEKSSIKGELTVLISFK